MQHEPGMGQRIRFPPFDLDLQTGQLQKNGVAIRLQEQPFRILSILLERPGELVTREELRERLWPGDTFVEFEQGLNAAVNRLRTSLSDSAAKPRWIETIPRRGYRFIGPVTLHDDTAEATVERPGRASFERILIGALVVALVAISFVLWAEREPDAYIAAGPLRRFSFEVAGAVVHGAKISPNGNYVVYAAEIDDRHGLWLKSLVNDTLREISGTEGADSVFWSPDSSTVAFHSGGEIRRVALDRGEPLTICDVPLERGRLAYFRGGTWSPDGELIVFASLFGVYKVPAGGGEPQPLVQRDSGSRRYFLNPQFLPLDDARRVVVYSVGNLARTDQMMEILDLETGTRRDLGPGGTPVYSPGGHLVHRAPDDRQDGLWTVPFSVETLSLTGNSSRIEQSGQSASIAADGTLAYLLLPPSTMTLVWRDRSGKVVQRIGQSQSDMRDLELSNDGRWAAVVSAEAGGPHVWIHDLLRSTKARLTSASSGSEVLPTFAPDSRKIAYSLSLDKNVFLMIQSRDDTGGGSIVTKPKGNFVNANWSNDGRYLVYSDFGGDSRYDINYVELGTDGAPSKATAFLDSSASDRVPQLSPDGRFVAYCSDESGRTEVYVKPFPTGEGKWQVSVNGGTQPRWNSNGSELFYVEDLTLMSVEVSGATAGDFGPNRPLFQSEDLYFIPAAQQYDVAANGQEFLTATRVVDEKGPAPTIRIVQNWSEEYRDQGRLESR